MKKPFNSNPHYEIGLSVIVKEGIPDPDYGQDLSGWQGRIIDIKDENKDDPLLLIKWDSQTLKKMPRSMTEACEKDGLASDQMYLYGNDVDPVISPDRQRRKSLLMTLTREPLQLARIHYDLFDKESVQRIFAKLRCMAYDRIQDRWAWLYSGEAKKLKFKVSYRKIPKERQPIILGSFFSRRDDAMFLDVNSFDRAKKAILFFDKYIKRKFARVTEIEIVNKFFENHDGTLPRHQDFFDKNPVETSNPEEILDDLLKAASSGEDKKRKFELALNRMTELANKPLPPVERFPIHFYEEGISGLEGSLTMRHVIAHQHWAGNEDYTLYDLLRQMLTNS
jgi:hypothetical protein